MVSCVGESKLLAVVAFWCACPPAQHTVRRDPSLSHEVAAAEIGMTEFHRKASTEVYCVSASDLDGSWVHQVSELQSRTCTPLPLKELW